ncbi:peptidylprolyl isomerase [Candidatus Nanohalococcus occultus]|uniref:peptidylprolyl isomerase n=1 Tax=Candidatus Nanohalococcus occultus TaxID=2978047 RepID=UPI0039E1066C
MLFQSKTMSKEVRASHILVENEQHATQIKREMEKDEGTFEEMAKEHSDCPSSKKGGDLGFFGRGKMAKPFEKKAFDMDVDEISEPVETQFGWHLIKKTDER